MNTTETYINKGDLGHTCEHDWIYASLCFRVCDKCGYGEVSSLDNETLASIDKGIGESLMGKTINRGLL